MEVRSFEAIVGALNDHGVRYLLVGGMAVEAHGHGRMTHDLDPHQGSRRPARGLGRYPSPEAPLR